MEENHPTFLLAESASAQIHICYCCERYSFCYKNLFMSFDHGEFVNYLRLIQSLDVSAFNNYHPEGFKAILKTDQYPGHIGFTYQEVVQKIKLMEEALMAVQIFDALDS